MQQGIRQAVLVLVLLLVAACSRASEYGSVAVDESAAPFVNEGGQEAEEPVPSPEKAKPRETPVQDDPRIVALADRIFSEISKARGFKVNRPIAKVFVKRKEIETQALRRTDERNPSGELDSERKLLFKLGLIPQQYELAEFLRKTAMLSTISVYDPQTKVLYIADSLADEQQEAILASLVPELAYAFLDQHFGISLEHTRVEGNQDASIARWAVVSGDALAAVFNYKLGPSAPSRVKVRDIRRFFRFSIEEQMADDTPQALMEIGLFSAVRGFSFMQFCLKWNGWEAADRLYSDLPISTEQIMHPERYVGSRDDPTEVKEQAPPDVLSPSWKRVYSNTLGEFMLYLHLKEFISEQQAKWGAQGWDGDRLELFENPDGKLTLVLRSVWDSEKEANQFSQAYADLIDQRYPGAQLVPGGGSERSGEKNLQWVSENNRILLRLSGSLAARGRSTFSELRWYPPMEAAKGSLSWVFRAKQPESVRTGP